MDDPQTPPDGTPHPDAQVQGALSHSAGYAQELLLSTGLNQRLLSRILSRMEDNSRDRSHNEVGYLNSQFECMAEGPTGTDEQSMDRTKAQHSGGLNTIQEDAGSEGTFTK